VLPENERIAKVLDRVGKLLAAQGANPFRSRAYRSAAGAVRAHESSMASILAEQGPEGLEALPSIGPTIAASIRELVETGQLRYLRRLEGDAPTEALLRTVPGIGPRTAHRLHAELGLETLEDLELAAHDGRLSKIRGFGPRRIRSIQDIVGAMLARGAQGESSSPKNPSAAPDVTTLLSVDNEYRVAADAGALPLIAPRRFNPSGEAWLPILHTEREAWHFTVLFSNTFRAHERHTTRDWVVVHYERNGEDGLCTVVTETHGRLAGHRVVRGRERECAEYYASPASAA
jgi:hypothetical protein